MNDGGIRDVSDLVEDSGEGLRPGQIVAGVIGILFIVFVLQNFESGSINFLWLDITMPVWVLTVIVFAMGIIFGWMAKIGSDRRKAQRLAEKKKR